LSEELWYAYVPILLDSVRSIQNVYFRIHPLRLGHCYNC
jgi:hypothetical protein